jgi:hypothetical protein
MSISIESLREFGQSNIESSRVDTLLPVQFAPNTETFRSFLKEYYEFLNQKESPSYVISRIIAEHDIDLVTDPLYLDKITYEVARGIPDSPYVQKVFLLKRLIEYYNIRGSKESIQFFFRVFFNEAVDIYYPWDNVLIPSSGRWSFDTKILLVPYQGEGELLTGSQLQQFDGRGNSLAQVDVKNFVQKFYKEKIFYEVTLRGETFSGALVSGFPVISSDGKFRANLVRTMTNLRVTDSGQGYEIGDRVFIDGIGNVTFVGLVEKIGPNGEIQSVSIKSYGQSSEVHYEEGLTVNDFTEDGVRVYVRGYINDENQLQVSRFNTEILFNIESVENLNIDFSFYQNQWADVSGFIDKSQNLIKVDNVITDDNLITYHDFEFYQTGQSLNFDNEFRTLSNLVIESENGQGGSIDLRFGNLITTTGFYENQIGRTSSSTVIQDSFFYQTFSYVIRSSFSISDWRSEFENLVHPSGFIIFNEIEDTSRFFLDLDLDPELVVIEDYQPPEIQITETETVETTLSVNLQDYIKGNYFADDYFSKGFQTVSSGPSGSQSTNVQKSNF